MGGIGVVISLWDLTYHLCSTLAVQRSFLLLFLANGRLISAAFFSAEFHYVLNYRYSSQMRSQYRYLVQTPINTNFAKSPKNR